MVGDSAGGNLVLSTMMYLRDEGYPLPSGAILMSPWVDLTMSMGSWDTNAEFDYLPMPKPDDSLHPVKCLLGDEIHKYLTHPYVSPLFGDFHDLPPLLIQCGEAEVLRDEITLLSHKASLAGVSVVHEIYEDQVHVFQTFLYLEASRKAFQSQRKFVKTTLPNLLKKKRTEGAKLSVDYGEIDEEMKNAFCVDEQGKIGLESLPTSPSLKDLDLPEEDDLDLDSSPTSTPPPPELSSHSPGAMKKKEREGLSSTSSSHPDLKSLVSEYQTRGPDNMTTVFGALPSSSNKLHNGRKVSFDLGVGKS